MASVDVIVAGSASGQAPITAGSTASASTAGIQGPVGPIGPTGPLGPSGATGNIGPLGPSGATGVALAQSIDISVSNPGGGNKFYLDGSLTPQVNLYKGFSYRFLETGATNSGHSFYVSTTLGGTHEGGSAYTDGWAKNGIPGNPNAHSQLEISHSAPDTLYYYCSNHAGMGGTTGKFNLILIGAATYTGPTGPSGARGFAGGNSHTYKFNSAVTDSDPGDGKFKFNNAGVDSVKKIYIDNVDANTSSMVNWLNKLDDNSNNDPRGHLTFFKEDDSTKYVTYEITGENDLDSSYRKLYVRYSSGPALSFSSGDRVIVSFAEAGRAGDRKAHV